ncbi:hypothetical protein ACWEQJ_20820 [Streptomyces cyaneofuscatus]
MAPQSHTPTVSTQTIYTKGDIVLFRNVEKFWLGKPEHTFVGRVERSWRHVDTGRVLYDVTELASLSYRAGIDTDYMRLLPPADAMHDIDTAPLSETDTGAMTPAAVAWLRRYLAGGSNALPAPRP